VSDSAASPDVPVPTWLGDSALLLAFGARIDPMLNARAQHAARALRRAAIRGVVDIVPAYASVTVCLHPREAALRAAAIVAEIMDCVRALGTSVDDAGRALSIPVAYGGDDGPDLARLAAHAGLSAEEVVQRHCAVEYRVAMLGFQPGFPYLVGLDPALAMGRLAQPRTRVPAGSVGIAGAQTGIYPSASPGGWNLIGRTSAVLFDPRREAPTLLQPGDRVRFRAVDATELKRARVEVRA
jgi:KipI family sensor histidine kinase inhibitor